MYMIRPRSPMAALDNCRAYCRASGCDGYYKYPQFASWRVPAVHQLGLKCCPLAGPAALRKNCREFAGEPELPVPAIVGPKISTLRPLVA